MAANKSYLPSSRFRSKRFRPDHNRQTSHENKLVPKKAKSTRMHSSESSMRALCQMAESAIARIEVLEKFDEEHVLAERPQTSGSDDTLRASDGDINRRLTKMLETALARISVLEQRRDICYTNAFKTTNAEGCLIRGCDAKPSQKNFIRHVKTTSTPEHEVAAAILKQTDCLQCGLHWQTPSGLAYHEALIHDENHPSRMDAFKPFLQQSLGCTTENQIRRSSRSESSCLQLETLDLIEPTGQRSNDLQPLADRTPTNASVQQWQPEPDSLQLDTVNLTQSDWPSCNDLQPLTGPISAYPSMQPPPSGLIDPSPDPHVLMQPDWCRHEHQQQSTVSAIENNSTQSLQLEYVWTQSTRTNSNGLYDASQY